ncbi:MAG: RNA methyltransferase, partial [Weeksellaceae bacterium]|nr:RNA methyltransferase [Weeksellaceae bacterium]
MQIDSIHNPRIKNLLKLQQKSRERKKQGLFVVEGIQENQLAMESGFEAVELYCVDVLFQSAFELKSGKIFQLSPTLFEKIAYRGTSGGILGIYQAKNQKLT